MFKRPATIAAVMLSTVAAAAAMDERMDAYAECWAAVAHSVDKDGLAGQAYEDAVMQSIDKANTACNQLARHAAATNGKDAVNEMWRYMEVQFANAHLREAK